MIYKYQHGDILKPLVIPNRDGTHTKIRKAISVYSENKKSYIFDNGDYLNRLYFEAHKRSIKPPMIQTRFYMMVEHEKRVKLVVMGRTLNIMLEAAKDLHPQSNTFLKIFIENKNLGGNTYPNFEQSSLIAIDDYEPTIDSEDLNEWAKYVEGEQEFYLEDYINKNSVMNNMDEVDELFWRGCVRELQQQDRNGKLEDLLTEE